MARSATPRLVNALRVGYYAFLGLGCGGILVVVGVILRAVLALHRWGMAGLAGGLIVLLVLVALVLVAAVWQVLRAVVVAAREKPGWIPPSSIPLNREEQGTMYAWIEALAQAGGLLPPDRIWLAAESGAYVYESDHGRELVLGGGLVAVLGRSALEGVVAHELAHFSAGDTRLVRETQDLRQLMAEVASRLSVRGWSGYNPFAWALRAYHYVYALAWASHSR
ncbi:MAG: M48 family metallopeptidase, partial [Planctomycetes bacterium]|nr:M48 family metallopeptidase [Planctomycetota bacterium]